MSAIAPIPQRPAPVTLPLGHIGTVFPEDGPLARMQLWNWLVALAMFGAGWQRFVVAREGALNAATLADVVALGGRVVWAPRETRLADLAARLCDDPHFFHADLRVVTGLDVLILAPPDHLCHVAPRIEGTHVLPVLGERVVTAVGYGAVALRVGGDLDDHGLPRLVVAGGGDALAVRAREALITGRRHRFANHVFWDYRYTYFPHLGSSLGPRGANRAAKAALLAPELAARASASFLDVGCGDLDLFAPFELSNYTGLDVSAEALALARAKRPDWQFQQARLQDMPDRSYDYVSAIDVLIYQSDAALAQEILAHMMRVARGGIYFSIHSQAARREGVLFDSSGLLLFVAGHPLVARITALGSYRDVSLYRADLVDAGEVAAHMAPCAVTGAGAQALAAGH